MAVLSAATNSQAVEAEVLALDRLDRDALRARWRMLTGKAAPAHLGRGLLVRRLAYELQARQFGDLAPATRRALDRLGASREAAVPKAAGQGARTGTLLTREWQGVMHRVMVVDGGYAWRDGTYPSLSAVAQAITGTRWNGPRFFGLRDAPGSQDRRSKGG